MKLVHKGAVIVCKSCCHDAWHTVINSILGHPTRCHDFHLLEVVYFMHPASEIVKGVGWKRKNIYHVFCSRERLERPCDRLGDGFFRIVAMRDSILGKTSKYSHTHNNVHARSEQICAYIYTPGYI